MNLEVSWVTKRPFLFSRELLGFLSIFKKCQVSPPLEATPWAYQVVKGCETHCLDEAGT